MQDESITQAERITVAHLLREVAAFGRQIRERQAAETAAQAVKEIIKPNSGESQQETVSN